MVGAPWVFLKDKEKRTKQPTIRSIMSQIKAIDKSSVHRICSGQVILDLATAVKVGAASTWANRVLRSFEDVEIAYIPSPFHFSH